MKGYFDQEQSNYLVLNISADFWQGEGKKKLGEENLSGCEDFFRMADFPGMCEPSFTQVLN